MHICLGRGNQSQQDCKSIGLRQQNFLQVLPETRRKLPENGEKDTRRDAKVLLLSLQRNSSQILDLTIQDSLQDRARRHGSERHGSRMCMQTIPPYQRELNPGAEYTSTLQTVGHVELLADGTAPEPTVHVFFNISL